jgi:hypothetical protein
MFIQDFNIKICAVPLYMIIKFYTGNSLVLNLAPVLSMVLTTIAMILEYCTFGATHSQLFKIL